MPSTNYERILLLISKRICDKITSDEFAELNRWIYSDNVSSRDMYGVLTDNRYAPLLERIVQGMKGNC